MNTIGFGKLALREAPGTRMRKRKRGRGGDEPTAALNLHVDVSVMDALGESCEAVQQRQRHLQRQVQKQERERLAGLSRLSASLTGRHRARRRARCSWRSSRGKQMRVTREGQRLSNARATPLR